MQPQQDLALETLANVYKEVLDTLWHFRGKLFLMAVVVRLVTHGSDPCAGHVYAEDAHFFVQVFEDSVVAVLATLATQDFVHVTISHERPHMAFQSRA